MRQMRNAYKILMGNSREKDHLGEEGTIEIHYFRSFRHPKYLELHFTLKLVTLLTSVQ
jgi:hypothetical protein